MFASLDPFQILKSNSYSFPFLCIFYHRTGRFCNWPISRYTTPVDATTPHTAMQSFALAPLPEPDLSLNIRPPFLSDSEAKEVGTYNGLTSKALYNDMCSSISDSGSSGSDLSHENGFFHADTVGNLGQYREPTLSLGPGTANLNPQYPVQGLSRNFNHLHNYQPHIYCRDFKRNTTRVVNGVKRSIRAPRMRWTTNLHAHFVHAVQLLGGHESKSIKDSYRRYHMLWLVWSLITSLFYMKVDAVNLFWTVIVLLGYF